ncbi:hypothetical protein N7465_000403 [Penicillium sp. CMV-2018d]|nr:hypothetical protein N7465_000403 [Penicillium sp. CMV-2018d]
MNQKDATQVCPGCRTISVRSRAPESEGPNAFVFDVTRFLGRCKWPPNFRWLDNCRLTGPEFSQNQLYWLQSKSSQRGIHSTYDEWDDAYRAEQFQQQIRGASQQLQSPGPTLDVGTATFVRIMQMSGSSK